MIPLYILGLLLRFGPQHGYQIKKLLEEQLEDFTQIKLPTVYYHLEKMEAAGLIEAHRDRQGARPEKTVYRVSDAGTGRFNELLAETLNMQYRPTFDSHAAFYFSDHLDSTTLLNSLSSHAAHLKKALETIRHHREETMAAIPEQLRIPAGIIFEHHILHFQAELEWAEQSIRKFEEADQDENEGH